MPTKTTVILIWILRIVAALILLQTLFFKFTASPESVYIFTTVGIEPWGRIGLGILELIAAGLILFPRTTVYGAVLGAGLMAGAIFSHFTILGIEVQGDGGLLFTYALIVLVSCMVLVLFEKNKLLALLPFKR